MIQLPIELLAKCDTQIGSFYEVVNISFSNQSEKLKTIIALQFILRLHFCDVVFTKYYLERVFFLKYKN